MLLRRDPAARPAGPEILRHLGLVLSVRPARAAEDITATKLVGREDQASVLRDAFVASRGGAATAVLVAGASGMGKSTLVDGVLDQLVESNQAVVLRGRAYEREAVPYKAVDSAVDALSRHLVALEEAGEPVPVPDDAWALGHLFPVLQRVRGIDAPAQDRAHDLRELRARAFTAMRGLLAALAERTPLVFFLDDVHWGDVDSARLLLDLVRPPAPAILLVMTCRDDLPSSAFLTEFLTRWPAATEVRRLMVAPLELAEAQRLALSLMDERGERAERVARAVARESGGSPFLIQELVRGNQAGHTGGKSPLVDLTLDQVVHRRLGRLSEQGRTLVELISVGGRPLPVPAVAAAMGTPRPVDALITQVAAERFVRVGLHEGQEVIEPAHDRIREIVVGGLSPETLRDRHGRLARALESTPDFDGESIAVHWLVAGDPSRAARAAQIAAEEAVAKLAFDQAARLFRMALETSTSSPAETRRLRLRLAQLLDYAGRGAECARVYLDLARDADHTEQLDFRRAAAEQLLAVGRTEEAAAILEKLLVAAGIKAPRSPLLVFLSLMVYRAWLFFLGTHFVERRPDEVSRMDRLRMDALWTAAIGYGLIDMVLATYMQARLLVEALRRGDRRDMMRAVVGETALLAAGAQRPSRREIAFGRLASRLAELDGTGEAQSLADHAHGAALFLRGEWKQAQELLLKFESAPAATASVTIQRRAILERVSYYMGDMKESERQVAILMSIAQDQGDLHTLVGLRTGAEIGRLLAADEPLRARQQLREARADWSHKGFFVPDWQAMINEPSIDLYVGDPGAAYDRFAGAMPALRRSMMLHSGYIRATTLVTQGRLAIASIAARPELRRQRIAEARTALRKLRREYPPWTAVLVASIEALVANAQGDRLAAISALRQVIGLAIATDSLVFLPPARYRLGELLGGEEGEAHIRNATGKLEEWGVKRPALWVATSFPGRWTAAR
jgi:hypothetical protein